MAIEYKFEVEDDLLRVTAWGVDEDLDTALAYAWAIVRACAAYNCRRILSDERELVYQLGVLDTFKLARFFVSYASYGIKAAVVCHPRYRVSAAFWETVAKNRGLLFRIFTSLEQAERWLEAKR